MMILDHFEELIEAFRGSFPVHLLVFISLFIIISPASPVHAAHEFAVYRMQQYDLQGRPYGCRNALVNVEARSIDAKSITRRCLVTSLQDFAADKYKYAQEQNAAGLLVLLPQNLSSLSSEEQDRLLQLEQDLMDEETSMPVYFTTVTDELSDMFSDLKRGAGHGRQATAVEEMLSAVTGNGFQLVFSGQQAKAQPDFQVFNIQGKLSGLGIEERLPTIAIIAHYDSYGVAPGLATGVDSNGSGVIALLEIARLFGRFYANAKTHAKYNLLFLLSGAGKFNYQGTKHWIEEHIDTGATEEATLLSDISYALCLDTIGSGAGLSLHVSKPPKEGSPIDLLMKSLQDLMQRHAPTKQISLVHKKINLADEFLAWEHERFSIRRLPAMTLSSLQRHDDPRRSTILDTRDGASVSLLADNIRMIVESLARHIYGKTNDSAPLEVFSEDQNIEMSVKGWLEFLSSKPRAQQLITKDHPILTSLLAAMSRHLSDVQLIPFTAEKRDPEFVFYSGISGVMASYSVKPALFDLFLALCIAAYLAVIYLLISNFGMVQAGLRKVLGPAKLKRT
ncbi:PREDICTED: nicalin-1-like [Priapulus caudatus]|uniref:Nicalin n=1 Tax=Priapulus caudatus TaxID=37621 RepID=A0ABM1DPJ0_PRICU|nr:PREDICTED: nicalin-1-like [Priapulus caudatus]